MKLLHIKWLLCAGGLMATACTKPIHVNLNDASPQLVIEGNVLNTPGPYYVQIHQSVNFSEPNVYPPVSGAVVILSDSTSGLTDRLSEITPGIYATDSLQGIPGHHYRLFISIKGHQYAAASTMPQPVSLDSVTIEHMHDFGTDLIFAVANFQDPAGVANYYTFLEFINGKRPHKQTFTLDDRLSDGKYIVQQFFTDSSDIKSGDTVSLQMSSVDKHVYDYFKDLPTGNNGQSASPANPQSNISGGVLGYFSAQTIQLKSVITH
ncbi:MAG TPA: DUF4249 domain-containing protein [Chitinophagaceae bacterium]|nr:DUF4249 domain-containing protein [Chitinophagaceae bacterium]